jgi:hypothetical protein
MTNKKITLWLAAFVLLIVAILLLLPKPQPETVKPFVSSQQTDPGGRGQCLGNQCFSSPPNLECFPVGNGCETRVLAGAQQEYTPDTKAQNGDYAEFFMQTVAKNNLAMEKAGIQYGDVIMRVNGVYAGSDLEFAKLVLKLPAGTKLQIWRRFVKDGQVLLQTLEVTL